MADCRGGRGLFLLGRLLRAGGADVEIDRPPVESPSGTGFVLAACAQKSAANGLKEYVHGAHHKLISGDFGAVPFRKGCSSKKEVTNVT